jgi:hypothetical protein
MMVDNDDRLMDMCAACRSPQTRLLSGDARVVITWIDGDAPYDYLSLDVDDATLATLQNIPLDRMRFKVITIEHDAYRVGPAPREAMREILTAAGYTLAVADVRCGGGEFEDWWIDAKKVLP